MVRFGCRERLGTTKTPSAKKVDRCKNGRPLVAPTVNIKFSCRDRRPRRSATQANNFCRGRRPRRPANKQIFVHKKSTGRGGAIFAKQICHEAKRSLLASSRKRAIIANKKRVTHTSPEKQTLIAYKGGRTKFAPTNIKNTL